MRDIFEDIFQGETADPMEAARRNMRANLRARFYKEASTAEGAGGYAVLLDGRPVRTPARQALAAPVRELADALAREWAAQENVIDPAAMPLTRLANSIIDGVMASPGPVAAEIENYLGSDLLFYRASDPAGLVENQCRHWDPVLAWVRETLGASFVLTEGMMHVVQPDEATSAVGAVIPRGSDASEAWRLGALNAATSLLGSALLSLALAAGRITPDEAWAAAHVDEDWNMQFWGRDALAMQRRDYRRKELDAAATVLAALRN